MKPKINTMKNLYPLLLIVILIAVSTGCKSNLKYIQVKHQTDAPKPGSNFLKRSERALAGNKLTQASKFIEEAVDKCPCKYKSYFFKGIMLKRKGHFNPAKKVLDIAFQKAIERGATTDTITYELASVFAAEGNYYEAWSYISNVDDAIGKYVVYNKAVYALKSGNWENAFAEFSNFLENYSSLKHESHFGRGLALMNLKKFNDALLELQKALSIRENQEVRLAIVTVYFKKGERERAVRELKKTLNRHPGNQCVRLFLTNCLINDGKLQQAKTVFAFSSGRRTYKSMVTKSNILFRSGKYARAKQVTKNALKLKKNGEEALVSSGNIIFAMNDIENARKNWEAVLATDENNPVALEGMGIFYFNEKQYERSMWLFNKAMIENPGYRPSYDALISMGFILLNQSNYTEAKKKFANALTRSKKNEWALVGMGICFYQDKQYEQAYKHFAEAVKLNPQHPDFNTYLGQTEYWLGKIKPAIKHLEIAIASDSLNVPVLNALGFCYAKLNQFERARELATKVRNLEPKNGDFYINSAAIESQNAAQMVKDTKEQEAETCLNNMNLFLEQGLALNSDISLYYINKGYGYSIAKKYSKALESYGKIEEPFFLAAKENNTGVVYALQFDYYNARTHFTKAKKLYKNGDMDYNEDETGLAAYNFKLMENYSNGYGGRKAKEYISETYFFLTVRLVKPELHNELNVPEMAVMANAPSEKNEELLYSDNTFCQKQKKTSILAFDNGKPKSFKYCP